MQTCADAVENLWRVLKQIKLVIPYDLEIPLLSICPKDMGTLHKTISLDQGDSVNRDPQAPIQKK